MRNLSILVTVVIGIILFYFVLYYSFDYVIKAIDIEDRDSDSRSTEKDEGSPILLMVIYYLALLPMIFLFILCCLIQLVGIVLVV